MHQPNMNGHETSQQSVLSPAHHDHLSTIERLVWSIAEAVVKEKSQVHVASRRDEKGVTVLLTVAPADLRELVGGVGRMAESMRTIVQSAGMRQQQRFSLRIDSI